MPEFNRILITGAAGSLGTHLRNNLKHLCTHMRLVDRVEMGEAAEGEELIVMDLSDREAAIELTKDVDIILHFAGVPREQSFDEIMTDTIPAAYHMYEGARLHGAKRVVYASSIHAVGMADVETVPDTEGRHRPDTFYGMTKCFIEDLGSLYWDKWGVESVNLRICSCFPEPADRRMLWSWLSFDDCVRLTEAAMVAPRVAFSVIYGTSDNARNCVSNAKAGHIGYRPLDSADAYAEKILAGTEREDPNTRVAKVVGGWFSNYPHPDDAE
ncbi:MAG: NAD-dependent epimerase/dehydratase family protein [Rhodobacteraceae bacterium]|nr:NAD-dependent epimerase/dehydratase family protein [Paracoccaceae bacterium]